MSAVSRHVMKAAQRLRTQVENVLFVPTAHCALVSRFADKTRNAAARHHRHQTLLPEQLTFQVFS